MSEHLDKAKAALEHARDLGPEDLAYHDLLKIAAVQAEVAQAAALERIAAVLAGPPADAAYVHVGDVVHTATGTKYPTYMTAADAAVVQDPKAEVTPCGR